MLLYFILVAFVSAAIGFGAAYILRKPSYISFEDLPDQRDEIPSQVEEAKPCPNCGAPDIAGRGHMIFSEVQFAEFEHAEVLKKEAVAEILAGFVPEWSTWSLEHFSWICRKDRFYLYHCTLKRQIGCAPFGKGKEKLAAIS